MVVLGAAQIMLVTVVELKLGQEAAPLFLEVANSLLLLALTGAITTWLVLVSPDSLPVLLGISTVSASLREEVPAAEGLSDSKSDQSQLRLKTIEQDWLNELHQFMQIEAGYRNSELTIRVLSEKLNIPEHRLRRLINQHLGYRNFNEYLNQFRISEAAARLSDPAQEHLPVLSIAMEVGYASLTPFNRAFKSQHDKTPTEYRRVQITK
jgi:AraC-like DNA-binding protein